MYRTIIQSPGLRALALAVVLILVAVLGFCVGIIREDGSLLPQAAPTARTFSSDTLGIAFEYSSPGTLEERVFEKGECPAALLTENDQCDHRYIGFTGDTGNLWFLSAESSLFMRHPLPREGMREDTIHSQNIDDYCTEGLYPLSCEKSTNAEGLRMAKVGYLPACNGFEECGDQTFFITFIETKNPVYPIVAVWHDRSEERAVPDTVIDEIIASIRPNK